MMQKKIKVQLPLGETVELYEQEVKSLVNKLKKTVEVIVVDNANHGKEKEMTEEIQKRMEEKEEMGNTPVVENCELYTNCQDCPDMDCPGKEYC